MTLVIIKLGAEVYNGVKEDEGYITVFKKNSIDKKEQDI